MKVKVTHTLDVKEVPKFVNQIITECRSMLQQQADKISVRLHNVSETIEEFNYILADLNLVQDKIEDAANILIGWDNAINPPPPALEEKVKTKEKEDGSV